MNIDGATYSIKCSNVVTGDKSNNNNWDFNFYYKISTYYNNEHNNIL